MINQPRFYQSPNLIRHQPISKNIIDPERYYQPIGQGVFRTSGEISQEIPEQKQTGRSKSTNIWQRSKLLETSIKN